MRTSRLHRAPRTKRILVVRTDRMGDVILATPLIRALRQTYPDAFLAAMVRPYATHVLLHNPHLNEILIDDYEGEDKGRKGFWHRVRMLRKYKFDTALLLLPTQRAAWMLFFAGIPRRVGVGLKFYEAVTFMKAVSRKKYVPLRHEADYCLDLGRKIGVRSDDLNTEIFLTAEERQNGRKILSDAGVQDSDFLLGIHPGSGRSVPNWAVESYVELTKKLLIRAPTDVRMVITSEHRDTAFPLSERLIDLSGKLTLRQLISVLAQCRCLFSSNTGPMHIASALKVATVTMFCPLPACSPQLWGPQGNRARIILPPEGFCQGRCPGNPKVCQFDEITVEHAMDAILDTVSRLRVEVSYDAEVSGQLTRND